MLPCDLKPHEPCNTDRRRFFNNSLRGCFLAGDTRVSENTALAGMHTIFVRLHNHYAKQLRERNPRWSSNLIFQTTRKIVVAVVQHITFKEWLPIIIRVPKYRGYNPRLNPGIRNEFATAVFRFGHTLIKSAFQQLNKHFNNVRRPITIRNTFF